MLAWACAHAGHYYILTSSGPHKFFKLQYDFSSVKIPTILFKTISNYLSILVLDLLAYLCPKVEYDVTNDNAIFGSFPVIISEHKARLVANERSH